jgi:CTP:molybdopterin cytidylyltransferase MocA
MIFAVVPANGRSTRMGRPKLALPLGGSTVLGRVVKALRDGGADVVVAVFGPHAAELVPLAEAAGCACCPAPGDTLDMRATVELGLAWLEERYRPGPDDAWLLAPADHPTLDAAVVRALLAARAAAPAASVFIPTFGDRRGHPALLGWHHVDAVRRRPPGEGLNVYLRGRASATRLVPVADAAVLGDLDTPEDYRRLLAEE